MADPGIRGPPWLFTLNIPNKLLTVGSNGSRGTVAPPEPGRGAVSWGSVPAWSVLSMTGDDRFSDAWKLENGPGGDGSSGEAATNGTDFSAVRRLTAPPLRTTP